MAEYPLGAGNVWFWRRRPDRQDSYASLVFGLLEDDTLNELVELKWIVGSTHHLPLLLLLHLVEQELCTLTNDECINCPRCFSKVATLKLWVFISFPYSDDSSLVNL